MALNQEQFDTLISHLESFAHQQPASYKLRVGLLAALGYAYIFFTLAGLLTLFVAIALIMWNTRAFYSSLLKVHLAILVAILVLIFAPISVVLRSLWVSFPPPQGLKLRRQDVPHLFALVDKLAAKLKVPRFHQILLTEDFNAAVIQRPRLGLLGWQQNYLLLGLPLMQGLSPLQFSAVVAHELGHLSGNHSRFTGWIYRVQKTYYQIFERLHLSSDRIGAVIFESFFNWYAPFFSAYSFVLRRINEYEADSYAAELTGAQNAAQALINTSLKAKFLHIYFWPGIHKQVETRIEPPKNTYTRMSTALLNGVDSKDVICFLEQALGEKTSNADTHPCLTDRLKALEYPTSINELPLPAQIQVSAASEFLGNAFEKLTDYFNHTWQKQMRTTWRQRYAYAQESLVKFSNLKQKAHKQALTIEEAWNHAYWTLEFESQAAAIPLLQAILATEANHISANYVLGQLLLQQNDPGGIELIEKAIAQDSSIVLEGYYLICSFLQQLGKIQTAKTYEKRIQQHKKLLLKAKKERAYVMGSDKFQPHNLPNEIVKNVCQVLALQQNQVKIAYLAQKVVRYFPDQPFYVLGVKRKWKFVESQSAQPQLLRFFIDNIKLPGDSHIMILDSLTKNIEKKLRQIPQAAIYQK